MRAKNPVMILIVCAAMFFARSSPAQESPLDAAKHAYEKGDYSKVIEILEPAATKDSNNGDMQLFLVKAYLETNKVDAAIKSAEQAVAINANNSEYHNWLGQAYGEKANHASMLSAYPLARKTQKEFETAVSLDAKNFDAAQNLIEYDCTAPSIVGGGEDKAQPLIQKLMSMDAAQGHFASGKCRMQKKDLSGVDAEFTKALESKPKDMGQIREMAGYFANAGQGAKVLVAADAAEAASPGDPRVKFFRAVGWILMAEKPSEAEKNLREYLPSVLPRDDYPSAAATHYWIGQLYEGQKNKTGARSEYEMALKLNPKYKKAEDALKKLDGS